MVKIFFNNFVLGRSNYLKQNTFFSHFSKPHAHPHQSENARSPKCNPKTFPRSSTCPLQVASTTSDGTQQEDLRVDVFPSSHMNFQVLSKFQFCDWSQRGKKKITERMVQTHRLKQRMLTILKKMINNGVVKYTSRNRAHLQSLREEIKTMSKAGSES